MFIKLQATSSYETFRLLDYVKLETFSEWIRIIFLDLEMPIKDGFKMAI